MFESILDINSIYIYLVYCIYLVQSCSNNNSNNNKTPDENLSLSLRRIKEWNGIDKEGVMSKKMKWRWSARGPTSLTTQNGIFLLY